MYKLCVFIYFQWEKTSQQITRKLGDSGLFLGNLLRFSTGNVNTESLPDCNLVSPLKENLNNSLRFLAIPGSQKDMWEGGDLLSLISS